MSVAIILGALMRNEVLEEMQMEKLKVSRIIYFSFPPHSLRGRHLHLEQE
jgi:hypothetical protein